MEKYKITYQSTLANPIIITVQVNQPYDMNLGENWVRILRSNGKGLYLPTASIYEIEEVD